MEWTNTYNPFNSLKVIMWREQFESIIKGDIPPPVSVTVDATNACDLSCAFCHYQKFRNEKPFSISEEDLMWVVGAIHKLGVKSCCYSGGGEPLLHPASGRVIRKLKDKDIQVGIITNGTHIDNFLDDIFYSCRWIGISVDAANESTYKNLKGKGAFRHVLDNIRLLTTQRVNKSPSVGYKFLIHPMNYNEIFKAARIAKNLGVDDFHARPCYGPEIRWTGRMIKTALKQVKKAQGKFDDNNFHAYGITHKFNANFVKNTIKKCEITPIAGLTFAADGYCYVCCDLRNENMGRLCKWHDILDIWGSEKHKKVLENIKPELCPHRCTYAPMQKILENVFRKDSMCRFFP